MKPMTIRVMSIDGTTATVHAIARTLVGGQPEARITLELNVPSDSDEEAVRDLALEYLDPA
jgi:hypothetical protein